MKTIYMTFDMDWAIDEILDDFYRLIIEQGIKATINITNSTKYIDIFRNDENIELGIHPNYNFLLQGENGGGGARRRRNSKIHEAVGSRGENC